MPPSARAAHPARSGGQRAALRAGNLRGLKAYAHPDGSIACSAPRPTPRASTPAPGAWPCPTCPKSCSSRR
jgi:hypothetical protein